MNSKSTKPTENLGMVDVQSSQDHRNLPISQVGVKSIRFPIMVVGKDGPQPSIGNFSLTVSLPAEKKGTHMSRFMLMLQEMNQPIDAKAMKQLMEKMLPLLEASSGQIAVQYTHFVNKIAPVSQIKSIMDYEVIWFVRGDTKQTGEIQTHITLKVIVPVMSLCPCSKEISEYGAHNQRSHITITAEVKSDELVSIEEVIHMAESQASCEIWGLLKRTDEKYVTEKSYNNPKFVEDLVRDVASQVKLDMRIKAFVVEAENFESIHNHSAYAKIFSSDLI